MLKVNLVAAPADFLNLGKGSKWSKLLKSRKSLHQPGIEAEIKRAYPYEPVVFKDGTVNIACNFPGGTNYVLLEKSNFVAVWGYQEVGSSYTLTRRAFNTWFRYYFAPEQERPAPSTTVVMNINGVEATVVQRRPRTGPTLVVYRLTWAQLGSRLQQEISEKWQEVTFDWMKSPERVGKYRPGLLTSGRVGKIPGINADLITANDPYVIELGDVVVFVNQLSDDDIML